MTLEFGLSIEMPIEIPVMLGRQTGKSTRSELAVIIWKQIYGSRGTEGTNNRTVLENKGHRQFLRLL